MLKIVSSLLLTLSLSACGGGADDQDSGFFWDGFFNAGLQWRCRDASNGQFTANWMCSEQKVGDWKWPTEGVPRETNSWFRGVKIETICKESIQRYIAGKTSQYQVVLTHQTPQDILVPFGYNVVFDTGMHWDENGKWTLVYKFDSDNWAMFVISANNRSDFYPAQCRVFLKENGNYKGYISI